MLTKWLFPPELDGDAVTINIGKHKILVSLADYEQIREHQIRVRKSNKIYYASIWTLGPPKAGWKKLHRFLLNVTDPTLDVHHRNRNPLDCRRPNLQVLTKYEHRQEHLKRFCQARPENQ